ncbi:MAG TPA: glycolate oxidase subunit GlcE [Steroidobacteraceae bacterium]|nr:glycolate oxidase subunit GlcE [Steroidobacteraceae bacterium]
MSAAVDAALEGLRERVLAAGRGGGRLRIRGAGTKDFLGEALEGELLSTQPLAGIVDYEPSELVVTARAGTRLSELEALLAAHGQFLAFEPPAFGGDPTLGGIVAAGLSGPRRASAGAARDFVLGLRMLSARGELLSFGGRVMKNVAGFDVARLLCGSYGILGLIVEASLKVLPRPAAELTLAFEMDAAEAILAFNRWSRQPLPLSATSWHDGVAHLRLSGVASAVAAARTALGGTTLGAAEAARWWAGLRDHAHPFLAPREPLWRLSVAATAPLLALPGSKLIEWAGALRWLRTSAAAEDVREAARRAGGSAALWHGERGGRAFEPLSPALLEIHRRLKAGFDPAGVFNHGRLVAGL